MLCSKLVDLTLHDERALFTKDLSQLTNLTSLSIFETPYLIEFCPQSFLKFLTKLTYFATEGKDFMKASKWTGKGLLRYTTEECHIYLRPILLMASLVMVLKQ